MKFDYYNELCAQSKRIERIMHSDSEEGNSIKTEADKSRELMTDRLGDDFLPPLDRRDLMSLIQNLGYICYEVWQLPKRKTFNSAEGYLMKETLGECIKALIEETCNLKLKSSSPKKLRKNAYKLLSVWHESFASGCDTVLCEGYEAVGDAILHYADAIETALAVN